MFGTHLQSADLLATLNVPELGLVVHTTCGQVCALRVERQANDLSCVAFESVKTLSALSAPQLAGLVE